MESDNSSSMHNIKSIFLATFDAHAGPKISCQYPSGSVTKEVFEAVSVYIIPKPQIQKRVITINALGHKITGYPNGIKNLKYARNELKFNLCFVCRSDARTVQYEPIVKKLSEYLENLELENGFLSNSNYQEDLIKILKQVLEDLNSTGNCTVIINLKERKQSVSEQIPSLENFPMSEKNERRLTMRAGYKCPKPSQSHSGMERRQTMISHHSHGEHDLKKFEGIIERRRNEKDSTPYLMKKSSDSEIKSRRASDADKYLKTNKKGSKDLAEKRLCDTFLSTDSNPDLQMQNTKALQNFRQRGFNKECSNVAELHLKLVDIRPEPPQVQDYHVPILLCDIGSDSRISHHAWDLTTQQILPHIDGNTHLSKIAAHADVEVNLVRSCVQDLVYYGVVKLLPIFQYSNVYTVTSKINKLYTDVDFQMECLNAVCKTRYNLPTLRDVFQLYCRMEHGVSIRDICIKYNPQMINIDERKLVKFGLVHEMIRRVYRFPVLDPSLEDPQAIPPTRNNIFYKLCNGLHHFDDICCKLGLTFKELNDKIERDSYIIVICK